MNRFISDTNKSTASLKVLESLSDECKLPTSCTHTNQPKYYHVYVFDRTKIRKIKLPLSAVNARESQRFHRTFRFPFAVQRTKNIHPINERKTVLIESLSPRKPNAHVNILDRGDPKTRSGGMTEQQNGGKSPQILKRGTAENNP